MSDAVTIAEASGTEREAVETWLREFNYQEYESFMRALAEGARKELFIVATLEDGSPVGGLSGSTLFDWLEIDLMAVSPDHRRRGVGRQLVAKGEKIARKANCRYVCVDTVTYQAPDFYRRLGFREVGRLPNWGSQGNEKFIFMKER